MKYDREYVQDLVGVYFQNTEEELRFFEEHILLTTYQKGDYIIKEGQKINAGYTLLKGCVREFSHSGSGEITSAFYTTGDVFYDELAYTERRASTFNWICLTDAEATVFPKDVEAEMYRRFPRLESMCRTQTERQFGIYKIAMHNYLNSSPEERYEELRRNKPEVLQSAPQYQIASYIGIKPESLSRIRKRLAESK